MEDENTRVAEWAKAILANDPTCSPIKLTNAWVNGVEMDSELAWDFYPDTLDTDREYERYWMAIYRFMQELRASKG